MKKILITLLLFIPSTILANNISNIDMDIYIDNKGTAHVTEEWNTILNEGTEGYKPYYNLGQSEISNFKVQMNEKEFEYINNWNSGLTFNDKKYKNGINYVNDGIELCFGISEYGKNKYTLTYDITNFVVNTSDKYQMIYWTLFPNNYKPNPERVYIKIHSDFKYKDNLEVWGYGKYGAPCYVHEGYIEMDSTNKVKSEEYMTILVRFPNNTFSTNATLNNDFNYYYNMSTKGSVKYQIKEKNNLLNDLVPIFEIILFIGGLAFISKKLSVHFSKDRAEKKFLGEKIKSKDVPYYRELPYDTSDIAKIYWIAEQYDLTKERSLLLEAVLLKLLKTGNITIKNLPGNERIIFLNNNNNLNRREQELYEILTHASKNNILTKNTFSDWCKKNYSKFLNWFDYTLQDVRISMANNNYIFNEDYDKFTIGPLLDEEGKKLIGLKKYLKDFSIIKDRDSKELVIWQDYMIYALIFGIADKVISELNKIYPNIIPPETYNSITFIEDISNKTYSISFNELVKSREQENNISSFGGGGGFSSGGGGGGSFGKGGGGGGFR